MCSLKKVAGASLDLPLDPDYLSSALHSWLSANAHGFFLISLKRHLPVTSGLHPGTQNTIDMCLYEIANIYIQSGF